MEIDSESVEYLHRVYPGLDVVEGDFLTLPADGLFSGPFALIGNYPYNISSQIFFQVLDLKDRIPLVSGMLQREVARRICAPAGGKERGILSVLLQVWYDCEYLFTVDEGVFNPPPKVVKTGFGQRRKTLRNSLSSLLPKGSEALKEPVMSERPERLTVADFVALTNLIAEARKQ